MNWKFDDSKCPNRKKTMWIGNACSQNAGRPVLRTRGPYRKSRQCFLRRFRVCWDTWPWLRTRCPCTCVLSCHEYLHLFKNRARTKTGQSQNHRRHFANTMNETQLIGTETLKATHNIVLSTYPALTEDILLLNDTSVDWLIATELFQAVASDHPVKEAIPRQSSRSLII